VGNVKRNARTLKVAKPERRVRPLDLPGRQGQGTKAVAQLRSGLVKVPGAIRTLAAVGSHKGVGDAFRQHLDQFPLWQSMGVRRLRDSRPTACGTAMPGGGTILPPTIGTMERGRMRRAWRRR
jgi:hypothetical protein